MLLLTAHGPAHAQEGAEAEENQGLHDAAAGCRRLSGELLWIFSAQSCCAPQRRPGVNIYAGGPPLWSRPDPRRRSVLFPLAGESNVNASARTCHDSLAMKTPTRPLARRRGGNSVTRAHNYMGRKIFLASALRVRRLACRAALHVKQGKM